MIFQRRLVRGLLPVGQIHDQFLRVSQLKRPHRQVQRMTAEIGEAAVAEVEPVAPLVGVVNVFLVRTHRRRPNPQVPVEIGGNRILPLGASFGSFDANAPDIHLGDFPQRARLDNFDAPPQRFAGAPLVPHLRHHLAAADQLAQRPGLSHAVRQRLLAINILARPDERPAQRRMPMVRRGNQHRIETRRLLQQFPVVFICLDVLGAGVGPVPFLPGLFDHRRIRIAERHEIDAGSQQRPHIPASLPAAPDDGEIEFAVGRRRVGGAAQDRRGGNGRRAESRRGGGEKVSARGTDRVDDFCVLVFLLHCFFPRLPR